MSGASCPRPTAVMALWRLSLRCLLPAACRAGHGSTETRMHLGTTRTVQRPSMTTGVLLCKREVQAVPVLRV